MVTESIATSYCLLRNAEKALAEDEVGITVPQLIALNFINREERVGMKTIAEYLGCTPAVVTGLIDRLERSKLVTRASHTGEADRRRVTVAVTSAGRAVLADADRSIRAANCEVTA